MAADRPLGPADSYLLLAPTGEKSPAGLPVVRPIEINDERVLPLVRLLEDGFATEVLRTLYLAKQLVREISVDGKRFSEAGRRAAAEPLCLLLGAETARERGLAVPRWFGGAIERPATIWLGFSDSYAQDKALVQTLTSRLAVHVLDVVATGGTFSAEGAAPVLAAAYRMALEVIAREWRDPRGPRGAMSVQAGTETQRELFADIRENRFVMTADRAALRSGHEMLADPGVAATVLFRLAQDRAVAQRVAPKEFYAPFAAGRLPEGVSPAAVLGPFRNFQAKLLGSWAKSVLAGHGPRDIVDLLEIYGREFPTEKAEVIRVFVVTTFGATVKPGGVSARAEDAKAALADLTALVADLVAGRKTLRDGVTQGKNTAP